jgi:hypothetical protein
MDSSLVIVVVVQSAAIKDSVELRGRPGSRGDFHRVGFSGIGRGGSSFHQPSHGGRGKLFAARENGVHPGKRVSPAMSAPTDFAPPHVQPRSSSSLSKCLLHYVC